MGVDLLCAATLTVLVAALWLTEEQVRDDSLYSDRFLGGAGVLCGILAMVECILFLFLLSLMAGGAHVETH